MLQYELNGSVLHITETVHGWHDTQVRHWYHNIKTWMVSSHGKEGDTPNRPMDKAAIEWVQKYYLPKVLDNT